jgi:uncharacterized protein DUF397
MTRNDKKADGWRKSSTSSGGECVEVRLTAEHVHVRDTKNRDEALLTFTHAEWRAFLAGVRLGEFELPAPS